MASLRPIVRSFSTTSVREQLVKAPVQVFGLDGRYASALYSAASKQKQLESVEKDLEKLNNAYHKDKILQEFFLNPIVSKNLKASAVQGISSKLSLSSCSTNLLALLAENGRLKNLPNIFNSFKILMSATRGDLNIEVICAKELDGAFKQELQATLQKFAKKGEQMIINYKIDPTIMGGLIVSIGDKYVDLSTANKLKRYTDVLKSTV